MYILLFFCVDNLDLKLPDMPQGMEYSFKEVQRQQIFCTEGNRTCFSDILCRLLIEQPKACLIQLISLVLMNSA